MERMKTDEDFRKRIVEAEDAGQRKEIAVAEGFEFSRDEIESVANELSDEELNAVAGGAGLSDTLLDGCSIRMDIGGPCAIRSDLSCLAPDSMPIR